MDKQRRILFLDLEWDQKKNWFTGNEKIMEIGATLAKGAEIASFFTFVQHFGKVNIHTKQMLRANYMEIQKAPLLPEACKKLRKFAGEPDMIVIWSAYAVKIFSKMCTISGIEYAAPILILQDELARDEYFGKQISFEKLSLSLVPEYDPAKAHNAGCDAKCLCSLYMELQKLREKGISGNELMKHIESEMDLKSKAINKIRGYKGQKVDEKEISEIAAYFHLKSRLIFEFYEVETGFSKWHIYLKDGRVSALTHQNIRSKNVKGFHTHKLKDKDVFSVMEYVSRHDMAFGGVPLYKRCE